MSHHEDEGVVLVGPTGDTVTVKSPAGITNYVYGMGYRPQEGTIEEAMGHVSTPANPSGTAEPGVRDASGDGKGVDTAKSGSKPAESKAKG